MIKIFGYENEHEEKLLSLEEMTIQCNVKELGEIIDFLQMAKDELDIVVLEDGKVGNIHWHYQDWSKTWINESADIIFASTDE